jgi:GTP cyclohydrolase I
MTDDAQHHIHEFIRLLVPDPDREGLRETPRRVVEAFKFFCSGYTLDPADVLKEFADGGERYDELVFVGSIPVVSFCEHHMLPFGGLAHVGYIPAHGRVVGLSKLARVVEIFARRLQVQERLTQQVAHALQEGLQARAVGVVLNCRHSCMEARGVQKIGSVTMTSCLLGDFKDDASARAEFLGFVARAEMQRTP